MTQNENMEAKQYFFEKCNFPNVIGAVDGTHIQIVRPSKDEHLYFNRNLKHSINAMVICDHKMRIRSVDGRYGGASHDSSVWALSTEKEFFVQGYASGDRNWILGDSGYPLEPWLMTPYRSASEGSAEAKYNTQHLKGRSIIERVFGILKFRFRCLLAARELHYEPVKAAKFLNICSALHNICIAYNVDFDGEIYVDANERSTIIEMDGNRPTQSYSNEAKRIQRQIRDSL